jgi:hypothetical protein
VQGRANLLRAAMKRMILKKAFNRRERRDRRDKSNLWRRKLNQQKGERFQVFIILSFFVFFAAK